MGGSEDTHAKVKSLFGQGSQFTGQLIRLLERLDVEVKKDIGYHLESTCSPFQCNVEPVTSR